MFNYYYFSLARYIVAMSAGFKPSELSPFFVIYLNYKEMDRVLRMGFKCVFITILSIILLSIDLSGQTNPSEPQDMKVTTHDGTVITGVLIREDENLLLLDTESGTIEIDKDDIKDILYVLSKRDKLYSGSHYLFGQSGYGLQKGQVYYENTYLAVNSFAFGITDRFSLTTGLEVASLYSGKGPLVYAVPKYSVPFNKGAFSVSVPIGFSTQDGEILGGLQAAVTIGSTETNVSFSGGYGYQSGDFAKTQGVLQLSGLVKFSDRSSFISENYLYIDDSGSYPVISMGGRFYSKKQRTNFFTVAAIILNLDSDPDDFISSPIPLPFISWTIALK